MIGGIGMTELIVILVIVLIIFGAGKLPDVGAALGKGLKNFKSAVSDEDKKANLEDKQKDDQNKV